MIFRDEIEKRKKQISLKQTEIDKIKSLMNEVKKFQRIFQKLKKK